MFENNNDIVFFLGNRWGNSRIMVEGANCCCCCKDCYPFLQLCEVSFLCSCRNFYNIFRKDESFSDQRINKLKSTILQYKQTAAFYLQMRYIRKKIQKTGWKKKGGEEGCKNLKKHQRIVVCKKECCWKLFVSVYRGDRDWH